MAHEAGKGDSPRQLADQKKYSVGWDRIFGSKEKLKFCTHCGEGVTTFCRKNVANPEPECVLKNV